MTFFLTGRQRIGAHASCMQHSPNASALSTSFLLNHAPNSPELNALVQEVSYKNALYKSTVTRQSYSSVSMTRESKRLKKTGSDWLNSGNALIQHLSEKMRFSYFPVLPGNAEAHII